MVSEERKTRRVVGVDNGMNQMNHAVQLLSSAGRLFEYVYEQWLGLSDEERKQFVEARSASEEVIDEMLSASAHKSYCQDIQGKAQEELIQLQAKRADIERRMKENAGWEEERKRKEQETLQLANKDKEENLQDENERAETLEEKARTIDLGKNLEFRLNQKAPKPKEAKDKPQLLKALPAGGDEAEGGEAEGGEPSGRRGKKRGKKEGKKEKKRHKKEKKRGADDEESLEDLPEEPLAEEPASPAGSDKGGDEVGKAADEEDPEEPGERKGKKHKKEKKKDKKHKDKKRKKRRHGKHGGDDSDEDADADAGDGDANMEDELFGSEKAATEEELFGPEADV